MASGVNLFEAVGVAKDLKYFAASVLASGGLVAVGLLVRKKALAQADGDALPEAKFNLFNALVEVMNYFRNLLKGMIGHGSDQYLGIIATTFVLIFISNFMGLIPGLLSPTADFNNNLAMGLFVFAAYQFFGFRANGIGYLKHFMGGMPLKGYGSVMMVFTLFIGVGLFFLELFSHFIRPMTLSLRLWGVVNGDHTFEGVVSGLVPLFLPIVAMALGLIVCVVQALVFTLLSTVYIQMAVSHDH
jgi:F-type H+-transporting ATPase subunit a